MYRKAILNRRWTNLRGSPSNGPKTTSVNQQGRELVTLEFLNASTESETVQFNKERQHIENMRRVQRRATWLLLGVALLVLGLLGNVLWQGRDVDRREQLVFTSLAAQAMKDEQFDRAMRFALQVYPARGAMPWAPF